MSVLAAVIRAGETPPIGAGMVPRAEAHLFADGLSRLVAFRVTDGPAFERIDGAYAPDLADRPSYPVTDVLLAIPTLRSLSSVGQRLDALSTKAEANYGRDFTAMVFTTAVEWGSDGYGRLFEARSQLEAHPFDGEITVTLTPAASDEQAHALRANLSRIDGPTRVYEAATETDEQR